MEWKFNNDLNNQIEINIYGYHIAILFPEANVSGKYMPQLYVDDDRDYVDFETFNTCEDAINWVMENIEYIKTFR